MRGSKAEKRVEGDTEAAMAGRSVRQTIRCWWLTGYLCSLIGDDREILWVWNLEDFRDFRTATSLIRILFKDSVLELDKFFVKSVVLPCDSMNLIS